MIFTLHVRYIYNRFLKAHAVEAESSGKATSLAARNDVGDKLFFLAKYSSSGSVQVRRGEKRSAH